jgi:hypothetical protein
MQKGSWEGFIWKSVPVSFPSFPIIAFSAGVRDVSDTGANYEKKREMRG